MQHGHLNLNANEATMILKVCDMNELDAEERLRRVNDLYQEVGETSDAYLARILDTETGQFLTQIRDMEMEEEYAKKTLQKNKKMRKISEQRIARKIKRLSNKKLFDEDGNEIVDSDLEAWEEYDNEQFFEEYAEVPVKEERAELGPMLGEDGKDMVIGKDEALDGVKFVRHERKADNSEKGAHTTARLKLDDAVARANAAMEARMKAREEKRKAKEAKRLAKLAEEETTKKAEDETIEMEKKVDVTMEETTTAATATTTTTVEAPTATAGEEKKPVDETIGGETAAPSEHVDARTSPSAANDDDDSDDDDSDDDIEAPLEIDESELFAGWSEARIKGWKNPQKTERVLLSLQCPGRTPSERWLDAKRTRTVHTATLANKLPDGKANYEWGTFSISIPGRVGYQCSNYYRSLVKNGVVQDENYMLDDKGELRFNFKNKVHMTTIGSATAKIKAPPKPKKPKMRPPPKIKKPKLKKPKKEPKSKKRKTKATTTRKATRLSAAA